MANVLIMPFIDESESFTNGFECGQIWQSLQEGEVFDRHVVHSTNIEQIKKMCDCFGLQCEIEDYDSEWSYLTVQNITLS